MERILKHVWLKHLEQIPRMWREEATAIYIVDLTLFNYLN